MMNATREKTRLWLLLLIGVVATLLGQTHAREIFAPSPPESGIFATQTQASTGQNYDGIQYDALDSLLAANSGPRQVLYHCTNEAGHAGITSSKSLNPSLKALSPNDVRYGNGQYLSDIVPGTKTPAQLSREFLNQPFQGSKFTHHVEIDVSGLGAVQGRPGVWVVPNETPLNLSGRILGGGKH